MVEKKEPFDEKCRRLGLFDKSLEDIIDMIAEKNREIERLRKAVDSAYLDVYQTAWMESWDTAALAMEEGFNEAGFFNPDVTAFHSTLYYDIHPDTVSANPHFTHLY